MRAEPRSIFARGATPRKVLRKKVAGGREDALIARKSPLGKLNRRKRGVIVSKSSSLSDALAAAVRIGAVNASSSGGQGADAAIGQTSGDVSASCCSYLHLR